MTEFAFRPDPKPAPTEGGVGKRKPRTRSHASPERIQEIRAKKAVVCRLCGTTFGVQAAHLVPRGMGGSRGGAWTESNVIGLCGLGNASGCHGLVESHDSDACHLLRTRLTDAEYSYILSKRSEEWLDRRYPAKWELVGRKAS